MEDFLSPVVVYHLHELASTRRAQPVSRVLSSLLIRLSQAAHNAAGIRREKYILGGGRRKEKRKGKGENFEFP